MDYAKRNPTWHEEDGPAKATALFAMLDRHAVTPASVIEVGCGTGAVLASMMDWWCSQGETPRCRGWDVAKLPLVRARAHQSPMLTFHHGAIPAEVRADLLLCVDVFEHVADDIGFVRRLRPHAPWMLFRIPLDDSLVDRASGRTARFRTQYGHVHAYRRRTALERLRRAGVEVVDWAFHRIEPESQGLGQFGSIVRALAFRAHPRAAARVLGGWSLVVLGRPNPAS